MRNITIIFLAVITLVSCKENEKSLKTKAEEKTETKTRFTLTPFSESTEYAVAKINSMTYMDGKFKFDVSGDKYQLGLQTPDAGAKMCANSAKGQHIHLIVDNGPYAAKYVDTFDHEISDGEHHLLAFLSRSYHESIKSADAHTAQIITVKDKTIVSSKDVEGPMLYYSRPKGTYVGDDTKKVMLDFFLKGCNLNDGHQVKANINGEVHMVDTWQPYYIEGLPMGENTITLTLVDQDGNTVEAPLNPVTRTFTLKEDLTPKN